jgi:hypothetical protein
VKASFKARLRSANQAGTMTFIAVPAEVMRRFAPRKRVPVKASLNRCRFRTTIADMGYGSCVGVRKEVRDAARITPGDMVAVTLELDLEERTVTVPRDFRRAMAAADRAAFDALSYSRRKELVQVIEAAKKPETRRRRIARAIEETREQSRRRRAR